MKKLLLSGGVIGLFLLYGWHQKQEASEVVVTPPQNTSNQPTPISGDTSLSVPSTQGGGNTPQPTSTPTSSNSTGQYKDGTYTGSTADAFYGNIQVQVTIAGGKISDVQFLQYPNDRGTSIMINTQAMPYLKQEAIAAQSANVDIVSGATDSSQAFRQSLQSALDQAKG